MRSAALIRKRTGYVVYYFEDPTARRSWLKENKGVPITPQQIADKWRLSGARSQIWWTSEHLVRIRIEALAVEVYKK